MNTFNDLLRFRVTHQACDNPLESKHREIRPHVTAFSILCRSCRATITAEIDTTDAADPAARLLAALGAMTRLTPNDVVAEIVADGIGEFCERYPHAEVFLKFLRDQANEAQPRH